MKQAVHRWIVVSAAVFGSALLAAPEPALGSDLSEALQASLTASVAVPVAGAVLVSEGGRFSVVAARPVGRLVELGLHSMADGSRVSVTVSAELALSAGLAVGAVVEASAVTAGWLLIAAGEVVAFVPNATAAALIHEQVIR